MNLPRLLYLGQVPVAASYAGAALLFRLLYDYPAERLMIVESSLGPSLLQQRLPSVPYRVLQAGNARWLHTRFATWYSSWLTLAAGRRARKVELLLGDLDPQAVLTIAHGYLWETAARFAAERKLPLHLICHDDWPRFANVVDPLKRSLDTRFGAVYRQAASRLCVSPFMVEEYRRRYGIGGTILYPSRAADCCVFDAPPQRLSRNDHPLTVAFGGTINSREYVSALKAVATALEVFNGRLLIFGPITSEAALRNGLVGPNITLCGLVTSEELIVRFREEVDVLFVPMSFNQRDRHNMEISFPSKLTDYTAVGLPILICGPAYCSAVRWARDNSGVGEVVDDENPKALTEALRRLAASPAHRIALGTRALHVGDRHFTQAAAQSIFQQALIAGHHI